MKFTFTLRGAPVTLSRVEAAVAVRPTAALRAAAGNAERALAARFGGVAGDVRRAGVSFGLGLPAGDRDLFRAAGWVFAAPDARTARAADTRGPLDGAAAARPVFTDRGGSTLVGTDLVAVRLPADFTDSQATAKLRDDGLRVVRRLAVAANTFEARLAARVPYAEAVAALQARPGYLYAEPAFVQVIAGRRTPIAAHSAGQWQHHNSGGNGGVAGADIKTVAAWELTRGGPTPGGIARPVRVAVIDTGMQLTHPGLRGGVRRGGFFAPDGTGGATFVPHAPGAAGFPPGDHGTFCLGMAGARATAARGGCGAAPDADLLPVAAFPDQVGTQVTLARALAYAADPSAEDPTLAAADGADVISCSLGPNGADWLLSSVLADAIAAAARRGRGGRGCPVFWACTNGSFAIGSDEVASHPDVAAVGRSNRCDREDGSGFGPELAFLAPGRDVWSTKPGGRYGPGTGTSFAAPLAAGVAALVLARHPGWTRPEVVARLKETCDTIGGVTYDAAGRHPDYGHGRLNAERAVA